MLRGVFAEIFAAERAKFRRGMAGLVLGLSLWAFTVAAALTGLIFLLLGWYRSLAATMASWQASAIVGSTVLLLAVIGLLSAALVIRRPGVSSRDPASGRETGDSAGRPAAAVSEAIAKSGIRTSDLVLAALIAGMVLGASPRLRERVFDRARENRKTAPDKNQGG